MLGRLDATLCSVLTWQRYAGTDGRCAHVGIVPRGQLGDGTFRLRKIEPVIDPASAPQSSFVELRWGINAVILAGPQALPGGIDAVYYAGVHPAPPAPIRVEPHQPAAPAPFVHLPAFEYHVYALSTDGTLRILTRDDDHELTDAKVLTPYEWRGACNVADELMRLLRALDYRAWCSIVDRLNDETDRRLNTEQFDVGPVG